MNKVWGPAPACMCPAESSIFLPLLIAGAPARPIDQFGPEDSAAHGTPHQLTLSVDSNAIRLLVLLAKNIGRAVTTVSGKNTGEV